MTDKGLWLLIGRYGTIVISKTGSDDDLAELYQRSEGPHLLGFCKSGLIVGDSLADLAI